MKRFSFFIAVILLAGCSSTNPFEEETEGGDGTGDGTGIESDRVLPPGTESPTPDTTIYRSEATSDESAYYGNGYATDITYNSTDDTFSVDNLAFDGDNTYARGTAVASLGPYAVYEADSQYNDTVTDTPINQFTHRAIYGISQSGESEFAIVRTGAYVGYGFGGFVYQRNGSVVLPDSGQATFSGGYAGVRDFSTHGGLQYVTGDMQVIVDFDDFNDTTGQRGDAVRGYVTNREIYDVNGNSMTSTILDALAETNQVSYAELPTLVFDVGPGVMDDNGEIVGEVGSSINTNSGVQAFQTGNYYAVVSGEGADQEITGIIVVENTDEIAETGSVRETGGFIVTR